MLYIAKIIKVTCINKDNELEEIIYGIVYNWEQWGFNI